MFVLWCRWRYGGEDPYVVYHGGTPRGPHPHPHRHQAVLDGFALQAHEEFMKQGKGKV